MPGTTIDLSAFVALSPALILLIAALRGTRLDLGFTLHWR
jgi:hypothetical protein